MFIHFGDGKCPLCGRVGRSLEKEIYHCGKCDIAFNHFSVSTLTEPRWEEAPFWT